MDAQGSKLRVKGKRVFGVVTRKEREDIVQIVQEIAGVEGLSSQDGRSSCWPGR